MDTISGNLIATMHHLRTLVSQIKPQGDMTIGEFCVMSMIEKEQKETGQKLTPTSLNILLGTKKPATSRMITMLEKKGFVWKTIDEKDHRIYYLELTRQGNEILEKERSFFHSLMNRISMRLGDEEIDQILKALTRLNDILEEEIEVATN